MGWMRNYKAMGDEKLLQCLTDFEFYETHDSLHRRQPAYDAVTKVIRKGGNIEENHYKCRIAAAARGLIKLTPESFPAGETGYIDIGDKFFEFKIIDAIQYRSIGARWPTTSRAVKPGSGLFVSTGNYYCAVAFDDYGITGTKIDDKIYTKVDALSILKALGK